MRLLTISELSSSFLTNFSAFHSKDTAVSYQLHYPAAYSIIAKTKHELPSSLLGLSAVSPS